ncbi:hypothetical protein HMPREF0880_04508 [Yokenella regensburgei ATCC 43003]|nr:hypothetical protein HMPREF0880_04508 [Yokenella regensburgei ATCC 43003]
MRGQRFGLILITVKALLSNVNERIFKQLINFIICKDICLFCYLD